MKFFQRLGRALKNLTSEDLWRQLYAGSPSAAGVDVSPSSAMQSATVYACIRVLAESVAQLPLYPYIRNADGGKKRANDHSLTPILNAQPNEWQTAFEFREMLMGHLCLRGKAFAYKNVIAGGRIAELIPLHPDCMEVKQNPDLSLSFKYTPRDGGQTKNWAQAEIFYLRGMSSDGVNPLSPIGMMKEAVGLALATQKHGAKMFANGARFQGFLRHPGNLKGEAATRLRDSFDSLHGGENAWKTPVLEEGMDYTKVGMSADEVQFLDTRKFQRNEICSIFRVPPHMVGDLERATFSNIEQQSLEFVMHSLMPWLRRWEQAICRDLIAEQEKKYLFAEFMVDSLLRGDIKSRYDAYASAITNGWINRNEVRMRENLNPVDGLDEFLTPLNMTPGQQLDDALNKAKPKEQDPKNEAEEKPGIRLAQ